MSLAELHKNVINSSREVMKIDSSCPTTRKYWKDCSLGEKQKDDDQASGRYGHDNQSFPNQFGIRKAIR